MSSAPVGYEEIAPPADSPHLQASGPPEGYEEVPPPPPESLLARGWDFVNRGLVSPSTMINAVAAIAPKPPDMQPGESAIQYLQRSTTALDPEHPMLAGIRAGLSGAALDTANLASSLTSPASIALAGTGKLASALPKVGKVAGAARAALRTGELGAAGTIGAQGLGNVAQAGLENTPEAWQQRLQGGAQLAGGTAGISDVANQSLPSFKRAENIINTMRQRYAGTPIHPVTSYRAADALVNQLESVGDPVPPQLRAFVNRVQAAPVGGPPTFPEMQDFKSAINRVKFKGEYTGAKGQLGHVAKLIDDDIRSGAPHQQFLDDYNRFTTEEGKAYRVERGAGKVGQAIGAATGSAAGYGLGQESGLPFLPEAMGIGGYAVGGPIVGGMVNRMLERPIPQPPRLPIIAPSNGSRENYLRLMLQAKDGEISPTRLDQLGLPKTRRIQQPPEEP